MRINSIAHASRVNGPGLRSVIWFQGCNLQCPGCWNPRTHPYVGEDEYVPHVADRIFAHCVPGTEGLTISGGEPLQQAISLKLLTREVKARRPDWSIGLFTGYTHRELADGNFRPMPDGDGYKEFNKELWLEIRENLDFAIMGRYDRTQPTGHGALVSSANQKIELFSMRYSLQDFSPLSVEFSIDDTGLTQVTGFPV